MRRRRRRNPSTKVYVIAGAGVLAAGGIAFFAFREHQATAAIAAGAAAGAAAAGAILATVTTSDSAPSGDLAIRSGPSDSSPIVGGAEKGGTVIVLDGNASADYAKVEWDGGSRRPAVTGFAHKKFLTQQA